MNKKLTLSVFIGSIAFSLSLYSNIGPKGHVTYNPATGQGTISSKSGTTVGTIDYNQETHTGTLTGPYGGTAVIVDQSTDPSGSGEDNLTIEGGPYKGFVSIDYFPETDYVSEVSMGSPYGNATFSPGNKIFGINTSKGSIGEGDGQFSADSNETENYVIYVPESTYDPESMIDFGNFYNGNSIALINNGSGTIQGVANVNGNGHSVSMIEGNSLEIENSSGTVIAEGTGNYRTLGEGPPTNQPATYSTNWTVENPVYGVFNSGETIDRTLTTPYVVNQGYYTAPTIYEAGDYVPGYYTAPVIQPGSVTATTSQRGDWTRTYSEANGLSFAVENGSGETGTANYVNGQLYFNGEPVTYDSSTNSFYYTGTQNPAELL